MIELVLKVLVHVFAVKFKEKTFLICLGVMAVLFFPLFQLVDFYLLICIPLLIVMLLLAAAASYAVAALHSAAIVATSPLRIKELAKEYPELAALEKKRSILIGVRLVFFLVCIAIVVLGLIVFGIYGGLIAVVICAVAYVAMNFGGKEAQINMTFKREIVRAELDRAFTDVSFEPAKHFSIDEIDGLDLFRDFDVMSGNDLLEANRGDIRFRRCDIHLKTESIRTDDDGKEVERKYKTVFEGSVFRFELAERSPVRLIAATEGFGNLLEKSFLYRLMSLKESRSVETEMDEFNRRFDVYCEDQTAARVLLTPQMIDGLNRVGKLTKHEFAALFEDDSLYLFLSTPGVDTFNVTISNSQSIEKQHKAVLEQVALIATIIDNLYFKGTVSA